VPDAVAPDGSEIYFRVVDAKRASVVEVVLGPGKTSRPVKHRTVEEVWYFVGGTGEVWVEPAARVVAPGDMVVIPTGTAFQFRATGDEPLRFVCFTSPPWPGEGEAMPVENGGLGEPSL
jgi:mannose-6-phosphate isomerase-like protein (cupin superfamily)